MKLILSKKIHLEMKTVTKFWDRIKCLKFYLKDLDFGVCFPKRKIVSTYFLCQNIDIVFTDKNNKILKMCDNVDSEQFIKKKKGTYFTYYLPVGANEFLEIGQILKFKTKKDNTK